MSDNTKIAICTDSADCPLPVADHYEDIRDCLKVAISPPECEHGEAIITCRQCAADPPPRWQLVECDQGHPVMWMPDDGWSYPPPCMYCCYEAEAKAHAGCEHARHGRWRRWRVTRWLAGKAYALGVIASFGVTFGGGCSGCVHGFNWRGQRPYILGWPRERWRCLLQYRHWPGEDIGVFGFCGKCLPCPDCGSRTAGHEPGCGVGPEPHRAEVSP